MKTELSHAIRALGYNQTKLRKEFGKKGELVKLARQVKDDLTKSGFTTTRANHPVTDRAVLSSLCYIRSGNKPRPWGGKNKKKRILTVKTKTAPILPVEVAAAEVSPTPRIRLAFPPADDRAVATLSLPQVLDGVLTTMQILLNTLANLDAIVRREAAQHQDTASKLAAIEAVMAGKKAE